MNPQLLEQASQLTAWLGGTDIVLVELSGPGTMIRVRRDSAAAAAGATRPMPELSIAPQPQQSPQPKPMVVRAGSVGIVLHAHPLRKEPLVRAGQPVVAGQAVALLKIGTVLLVVPAPRPGVVLRVIAPDGSVAGYGDPLVELD